MAVTKIIPIKATVQKAVDYICNPDKTDDELYIDCSNCSPFCAKLEFDFYRYRYNNSVKEYNQGVKAYHQVQSFKPGEVTPELAHKIGKEFAKREFGEKFAYIVTTHIDKEHIHNHIISCAYSTDGSNKYHDGGLKDIYRRRNLSDEICKENGLSVIEYNRKNWQTYKEWQTNRNGTSWKQELKDIISVGLQRYKDKYIQNNNQDVPFVLYEKYSRRDVSFLMDCGKDLSSTMYGMKKINDDVFIFVTYHKEKTEDDGKEYIDGKPDYADVFEDNQIFCWDTQIGRGIDSSYTQGVMKAYRKHLMVKKSDAETTFYYMGQFDIVEVKPAKKLDNKGKERDIAKFRVKMRHAVRDDLLQYLESNID